MIHCIMILGGFMGKYVHNIKKYLTQTEFEILCYDLNYPNTSAIDILKVLGVKNIEDIDLNDIETTIQVSSVKKDTKSFIQTFEYIISNLLDYERNYVIQTLKSNGINLNDQNLEEFRTILEYIVGNKKMMMELNNMHLTIFDMEKLLQKYHLEINSLSIQNLTKLIHYIHYVMGVPTFYMPTVRNKYYDTNSNVVTKVNVLNDETSDLVYFKGEIFESLSFQNEEEAKKFKEKYQISEDIDMYTKSIIHFKGQERTPLDHNEIYILKQKQCIYIYYDVPHFVSLKERNQGMKSEELSSIRELLIRNTEDSEFRKYVLRELKAFEKSVQKKEYTRNVEIIDKSSIEEINHILSSKNYEENPYIQFKAEIVTSKELQIENQKNAQYVLKK